MIDLERIKQLEKQIIKKFEEKCLEDIIYFYQNGYALDKEHYNLVGLNLSHFELGQLSKSLPFFSQLKKLSLGLDKLTHISGTQTIFGNQTT